MPKNQKRSVAEKAEAKRRLHANEKNRYLELLEKQPNHKDVPLWREKLANLK